MKRSANARWQGNLKQGVGHISTESEKLVNVPYNFAMRFGNAHGANPEELIAAAHAGCFSMALSAELQKSGLTAESIDVDATVTLDKKSSDWRISEVSLNLTADIPNASQVEFLEAAMRAKENCPVSKLLNTNITLETNLAEEIESPLGL